MPLRQKLIEATFEVFDLIGGMEVRPGPMPPEGEVLSFSFSVTGMVGLVGSRKGMLAVHASEGLAMALTGNFLGLEVKEVNEDVKDAIAELTNILAGCAKSALVGAGEELRLSLPSTLSGKEYSLSPSPGAERLLVPFNTQAGWLLVELQMERTAT